MNYYKSKAKHIWATAVAMYNAECIMQNEGKKYVIPSDLEALQQFPGIGIKTAKLIAHVLYDAPYIAVDTHIHRVANRLGLVHTKAPEKTSEQLEKLVPNTYKEIAHHGLVLFGRYHCLARNPKCAECKLQNICEYYKGVK